jgi:hypothetical protein
MLATPGICAGREIVLSRGSGAPRHVSTGIDPSRPAGLASIRGSEYSLGWVSEICPGCITCFHPLEFVRTSPRSLEPLVQAVVPFPQVPCLSHANIIKLILGRSFETAAPLSLVFHLLTGTPTLRSCFPMWLILVRFPHLASWSSILYAGTPRSLGGLAFVG